MYIFYELQWFRSSAPRRPCQRTRSFEMRIIFDQQTIVVLEGILPIFTLMQSGKPRVQQLHCCFGTVDGEETKDFMWHYEKIQVQSC